MAFHLACPITWYVCCFVILLYSLISLSSSSSVSSVSSSQLQFNWLYIYIYIIIILFYSSLLLSHFLFVSRRICFCSLGFPRSLPDANAFLNDVALLTDFISAGTTANDATATVQVAVPKVVPPPPEALPVAGGDALDESASMKAKRVALQRKGAAAMIAAEEYARRFESGDVLVSLNCYLNFVLVSS